MFYVYILENSSGKRYIGHTDNLEARLKMHNSNYVKSTRNKGPWKFIIYKEILNRSEAMKLELYLKSLKNSLKAIEYLSSVG